MAYSRNKIFISRYLVENIMVETIALLVVLCGLKRLSKLPTLQSAFIPAAAQGG